MPILIVYLAVLLVMSIVTLILFAVDKKRAQRGASGAERLPERTLLLAMSFGGAAGGLIGMYALRHKTDKRGKFHFLLSVWTAVVLQLGVLVFLIIFAAGGIK